MKKVFLFLALLFTFNLYSASIDTLVINSHVKNVTVFLDGAQVTREAKINISEGKKMLVLERLPAEVYSQSIQVDNNHKGEILSVKSELAYPDQNNPLYAEYEALIKQKEIAIKKLVNQVDVFRIEEEILLNNSTFSTTQAGTTISEIREAASFYREKLNEIKREKLQLLLQINSIKEEIRDLYTELNQKVAEENRVFCTIAFVIDAKTAINSTFEISYFVPSAGWTPLYDFRVDAIDQPLNLVYNANIYQSTGEDWKDVNLTLSTNRPALNNTKPELKTWYIDKKSPYMAEKVVPRQSSLKGAVSDRSTGEPIPFANISIIQNNQVMMSGVADFDGISFVKPIKAGVYSIEVSAVGYVSYLITDVLFRSEQTTFQDFRLEPSSELLESLEVVAYCVQDNTTGGATVTAEEVSKMPNRSATAVATTVGGVFSRDGSRGSVRGSRQKQEVVYISGNQAEKMVSSLEYKIKIPYTIPTDGQDYGVEIQSVNIPVEYVYYTIPKLDKDVFLIAEINNWTDLDLLSGESSIYYKGTYTGESEIDANSTDDTLSVSLSRDKSIIVERTLLKEQNEKKWLGKMVRETVNWSITVRNSKDETVKLFVEDQFPLSERSEIEIEILEASGGDVDEKTGKVVWELQLEPNEKRELFMKYAVKHPEYVSIYVE